MKLYEGEEFRVGGVNWRFERGQMPQGSFRASAQDGQRPVAIIPHDWSKPAHAPDNAVLLTRSFKGNQWKTNEPGDFKEAVRNGTRHVRAYEQDKQIEQMADRFQNPQKPRSNLFMPGNDQPQKRLKGKAAIKAMQRATELFQDGGHHQAQREQQEKYTGR